MKAFGRLLLIQPLEYANAVKAESCARSLLSPLNVRGPSASRAILCSVRVCFVRAGVRVSLE